MILRAGRGKILLFWGASTSFVRSAVRLWGPAFVLPDVIGGDGIRGTKLTVVLLGLVHLMSQALISGKCRHFLQDT